MACARARLTITVKNKCINFVNEISLLLLGSLLHCVTPDLVRLWQETQKVSLVSTAKTYLHRWPQPASGCGSEAVVLLVTSTFDCAAQKVRSGVRSAGRRDLSKSFPKPCSTWASIPYLLRQLLSANRARASRWYTTGWAFNRACYPFTVVLANLTSSAWHSLSHAENAQHAQSRGARANVKPEVSSCTCILNAHAAYQYWPKHHQG